MKMRLKRLFNTVFVMAVVSMVLTACMDEEGIEGPAGQMMMVNAASGTEGGVEIQLNGRKANISAVEYTANTGYITVNNGDYDLIINEPGMDAIYHDPKFEIGGGKNYSLFVFGSDSIKGVQVEDNLDDTTSTQTRVRFFNFTENTPMLDLSASTEITRSPIFPNRSMETLASAAEHAAFLKIDPGTYSLTIVNSASAEDLVAPKEITLEAGKSYTIFASGVAGSPDKPLTMTLITNN